MDDISLDKPEEWTGAAAARGTLTQMVFNYKGFQISAQAGKAKLFQPIQRAEKRRQPLRRQSRKRR